MQLIKKVELARGFINEIRTSWGAHHMTLKTLAHFQKRNRTSVSVPTNFPRCQDSFFFFSYFFLIFFAAVHMGKGETQWGGGRLNCHFSFFLRHWLL